MHTNSLPNQLTALGAPLQPVRANTPATTDGVNFGATLTRQLEQRQIEQRQAPIRAQVQPQPQAQPSVAPQQAVAGPKPQPAPKPVANEAKPVPRAVDKAPAKETAQADTADQATSAQAAGAEEKTASADANTEEGASSADAKAADAVVDMLALVASFNQMQQAPAAIVPAAPQAAAAQTDALLASMQGSLKEGAEPLVKLDTDAVLPTGSDEAQIKAEPGVDLRALEMAKTGEAAKLPLDTGDFAAKLKESAAQAAAHEAPAGIDTVNTLTAQATTLQNAQAAGAAPTDRLNARVGTPAWDNQLGQKVIWMVGGEDQSATLELNPPDLGPVQVVLNVSNDMASVSFSSQQLEVRQALENALPRLREMMSESGIALGNASVNAGTEGRQGQDGQGSGRQGGGKNGNGGDASIAEVAPRQRTRIIGGAGAVDTFA